MKLMKKRQEKPAFKPLAQSQTDIDKGLRAAFKGTRQPQQQRGLFAPREQQQQQQKFNMPNYWGAKPLALAKPQQQPQRPMMQPLQQQQPQQEEEEAYWSAEDWEEWAIALYNQYPDYRAVLPDWFIEAMQEQ